METTKSSRRSSSATIRRSPQQKRDGSIESAVSLPESRSFTRTRSPSPQQQQTPVNIRRISRSTTSSPQPSTMSSPRPSVDRSTSTLRLRTTYTRDNSRAYQPTKKLLPSSISNSPKTSLRISNTSVASDEINAASTRIAARKASPQNTRSLSSMRKSTLTSSSPSAWALSPGRTLTLPPSSPSSSSLTSSPSLQIRSGATMSNKGRSISSSSSSSLGSSVLRYFQRHKRPATSPEEEEGLHQYRVMSNRLLQWRFANAKSEASMLIIKNKSEEKLFAVWVKLCKLRNTIAEKRSRVKRLRLKIKLLQMVCPQIQLLEKWEDVIDKKNAEAVGRVSRKLSAYATKLPLVDGANLDILDLYEALRFALELMQDIEIHITDFLSRAEETYDILTKIIGTMEVHGKCFEQLHEIITKIMTLKEEEMSLRANVIQANSEAWETQNSCKFHRFISAFPISSRRQIFNPLFSLLNVS